MIQIFKRVRQKLITQGNLKKYLLYAIGEIILVVIGILIALQINDWNDQANDRKLETQYYQKFKTELQGNIKNIDDQIKYFNLQMQHYEILTQTLKKGFTEDSLSLFVAIEHLGKTYPIEYANNIWTKLLYNGKTSLIQNEEFSDLITILNSELEQSIILKKETIKYNLDFAKLTGEILSLDLRKNICENMHPVRGFTATKISNLPTQHKVITELNKLKGLNGYLAEIYDRKRILSYKFGKLKSMTTELIDICDTELK